MELQRFLMFLAEYLNQGTAINKGTATKARRYFIQDTQDRGRHPNPARESADTHRNGRTSRTQKDTEPAQDRFSDEGGASAKRAETATGLAGIASLRAHS